MRVMVLKAVVLNDICINSTLGHVNTCSLDIHNRVCTYMKSNHPRTSTGSAIRSLIKDGLITRDDETFRIKITNKGMIEAINNRRLILKVFLRLDCCDYCNKALSEMYNYKCEVCGGAFCDECILLEDRICKSCFGKAYVEQRRGRPESRKEF